MNKKEENKVSNISIGFSIGSLIIAAIPLGFIAFILAIIAISKDESKGTLALILSIVLPILSFVVAMWIFGAMY